MQNQNFRKNQFLTFISRNQTSDFKRISNIFCLTSVQELLTVLDIFEPEQLCFSGRPSIFYSMAMSQNFKVSFCVNYIMRNFLQHCFPKKFPFSDILDQRVELLAPGNLL